jgi:hypothetical protein
MKVTSEVVQKMLKWLKDPQPSKPINEQDTKEGSETSSPKHNMLKGVKDEDDKVLDPDNGCIRIFNEWKARQTKW